jgi:glycosyltransferase involved in cell wall biosynthesis
VFSEVDQSHLIKTFGEVMDKDKYEVGFVFMGEKKPMLYDFFGEKGYPVEFFEFHGKKDLPAAVWKLRKIFKRLKPDIVHTHLIEGSMAGLTAAKIVGIKNRIHTRHMGMENHIYHPHGVYYDKFNNFLSKKIIAISNVVANILINHEGVYPVIGSISRFVHWKGVQNTILAFKKTLEVYPQAKLVLANAVGPYSTEIHRLLKENLSDQSYVTIDFESNIFSLYSTFDIFVHVPVNEDVEAFGMVYIEPLALEVPSVFTLSGIAGEFIKDKENALVVPYNDSESIANAVNLLLQDTELRNKIVKRGKKDVWNLFHTKRLTSQLNSLYTELYASQPN